MHIACATRLAGYFNKWNISGTNYWIILKLNLSLDDQTIFYKSFNWRQPRVEDDLNKIKMEYISNHLSNDLQWKTTSKY